jgi:predicted dinucleotide-binding enzyme
VQQGRRHPVTPKEDVSDVDVIDTSNYYPVRDGHIAAVADGMVESVWASNQFGRPVVKAFNAVLAGVLADQGKIRGAVGRIAIPVAGDNTAAKTIAQQLVYEAGFDTADPGSLAESWRQQPGTPAYCTSLPAEDLRVALAAADKIRVPINLQALMGRLTKGWQSDEEMTALNREINVGTQKT